MQWAFLMFGLNGTDNSKRRTRMSVGQYIKKWFTIKIYNFLLTLDTKCVNSILTQICVLWSLVLTTSHYWLFTMTIPNTFLQEICWFDTLVTQTFILLLLQKEKVRITFLDRNSSFRNVINQKEVSRFCWPHHIVTYSP